MNDTYRRPMNRQLTVQESRHRPARVICHGGCGQIRQAYRERQEDQLAGGSGPQRGGALEHLLSGRRPPLPAQEPADQLLGRYLFPTSAARPGPAPPSTTRTRPRTVTRRNSPGLSSPVSRQRTLGAAVEATD
ncbi:Tn3 family transposase [Streptomyces sp. SID724]|nr:Tn3 family transposase [Streptomyces sp. SID724]